MGSKDLKGVNEVLSKIFISCVDNLFSRKPMVEQFRIPGTIKPVCFYSAFADFSCCHFSCGCG